MRHRLPVGHDARLGGIARTAISVALVLSVRVFQKPASAGFEPVSSVATAEPENVYRKSTQAMGTLVEISIYGVPGETAEQACNKAFEELRRVEARLSFYDTSSELSELNRLAGEGPQRVSTEMFQVLSEADRACKDTQAGFDPSVGPLIKLWKRSIREGSLPTEEEIAQARSVSGWSRILLKSAPEGGTIEVPRGFCLDLGGVAKGYGVDKMAGVLREAGVRSGIVNAGGDLLVWGHPAGKRHYTIGVTHPRNANESLAGVLRCKDRAVVTSGDYEQWTRIDGQRYSHVVSPVTGRPSLGVASVTVSARTAARADALATGLMAVGPETALATIPELKDAEVLLMITQGDSDLSVWASPGLISDWEPSEPAFDAQVVPERAGRLR